MTAATAPAARVEEALGHALARLLVLESALRGLPIPEPAVRDGLSLLVGDALEDVRDALVLASLGRREA